MSNHKGHVIGGCFAYGITLVSLYCYTYIFHNSQFMFAKEQTLLEHLPTFLSDVEYTLHYYFPYIISGVTYIFSHSWSFIFIGLEWFMFALAGAMFPDIDIKSTSQKYLYTVLFFFLLALVGKKKFYVATCLGIVSIVPIFSSHRGLFHRTWFVMLFPFFVWFWAFQAEVFLFYNMLFFIAGALSHLWLDMGIDMFKLRL